jgi:hypothetical protein
MSMLGYSPSLFLLIPAKCVRSASLTSSMRAAGVRGQAWPIVVAPDGSGRDDFPPTSVHGIRTQRQRHREGARVSAVRESQT